MALVLLLLCTQLSVPASGAMGQSRPSARVTIEATVSNVIATLNLRLGGMKVVGSRMSRGVFRSKRQDVFSSAKNKMAVIVAGAKAGTGFLLRDAGRIWLITNAHVVRGQPVVRATMLDGTLLTLGAPEFAIGRDLVRFPLDGNRPALELRRGLPDVGDRVSVLGNSDGRGVITELDGKVLGVGPSEIEIDATFTAGNSGSPVIDREGKVVAVASYLRNCRNDKDWSKKGTRFNGIRRFALRLTGLRWEPLPKSATR